MYLGDLMAKFGAEVDVALSPGNEELYLFGVTDDSRDVRFGYLFCAFEGAQQDGVNFCKQAAARGAQAVAVSTATPIEAIGLSDYERTKIIVLRVRDVRSFYAGLCAHFHPGRPATLVGVTGTNGKTSTVSCLRDLWDLNGRAAISLGTLGVQSRSQPRTNLEAGLTTFDAKTIHIVLGELRTAHQVDYVAMEASSHALDQRRLAGLEFDAAVFTNLTLDHLDYHHDMDSYYSAKARLFRERLKEDGVAIINVDDVRGKSLADELAASKRTLITYGRRSSKCDLRLLDRTSHATGQDLKVEIFGRSFSIALPLAGAFQADNILAAMGAAIATGLSAEDAAGAAEQVSAVPGRLELVANSPNGAAVYVDYAHTPDALENVLTTLRSHVSQSRRLHVVFGCGGERDTSKRPEMGRIASHLADSVWVTDDNPRSEDPESIRAAVIAGGKTCVDAGNRPTAVGLAIDAGAEGDIIVVAGKGHEDYQLLPVRNERGELRYDERGKVILQKVAFSDQKLILNLCGGVL